MVGASVKHCKDIQILVPRVYYSNKSYRSDPMWYPISRPEPVSNAMRYIPSTTGEKFHYGKRHGYVHIVIHLLCPSAPGQRLIHDAT